MRRKRAGELLPTTTPTPPKTYHYPYSSPYLLPWAPPAFLEGWGQDRVRGRHVTAKHYYEGIVHFWPIQPGEKGQGGMRMFLVILNTLKFFRSGGAPPGDAHDLLPLLIPLPTTTHTPPLSYLLLPLLLPLPTIPLVHGVR